MGFESEGKVKDDGEMTRMEKEVGIGERLYSRRDVLKGLGAAGIGATV